MAVTVNLTFFLFGHPFKNWMLPVGSWKHEFSVDEAIAFAS